MAQSNVKSKPKRNPDKVALLRDKDLDRTSRLAIYYTEIGGDVVYANRDTIRREIRCNDREAIRHSNRVIMAWGLFKSDRKSGGLRRSYRHGEVVVKTGIKVKSKEFGIDLFKLRVQRTINKRAALAWILTDLVKDGAFVPHSNEDFAVQLDTTKSMISRYMNGYTTPKGVEVPGLIEAMNLSIIDDDIKPIYYRNPNRTRRIIKPDPDERRIPFEDVAHDLRPIIKRPR